MKQYRDLRPTDNPAKPALIFGVGGSSTSSTSRRVVLGTLRVSPLLLPRMLPKCREKK